MKLKMSSDPCQSIVTTNARELIRVLDNNRWFVTNNQLSEHLPLKFYLKIKVEQQGSLV